MASNGRGKARKTTNTIILDSDNEGALNNDSQLMTPPVTMQESAQAPIRNADNDDSDDDLPARVMVTDGLPTCRGVKRKSSELATRMNGQQPGMSVLLCGPGPC
jgi:hypothetical protein